MGDSLVNQYHITWVLIGGVKNNKKVIHYIGWY